MCGGGAALGTSAVVVEIVAAIGMGSDDGGDGDVGGGLEYGS